ncbi:hypothetical protein KL86SPO_50383 [uncultured Sporomusa sp.]|uniref:Uncharacterized protein n=1 Tax=uncultured Sporomusa sp. TaxID=307249 RepID=A0A212LYJ2_9FIRM|nr:hypothetical protein KL86SPO_50383 [uncultured Sporomusa sp.]
MPLIEIMVSSKTINFTTDTINRIFYFPYIHINPPLTLCYYIVFTLRLSRP